MVLNTFFLLSYFAIKKQMKNSIIWISCLLITSHFWSQDNILNTSEVVVKTYYNSKYSPDSVHQLKIVAGKKMEIILLNARDFDLSTNNYRQVFKKTPGIFVSEHDATGLQTSISSRGLSANRSWEFNMRQNGYDIASDPSGYPEAYFSPTLDAVAAIEVYRGSSALQYGSQFGGMINYQLKDKIGDKTLSYEGNHTTGSYGLFNSYNAIGGVQGRWSYYGFMHHRQAEGYRSNSQYYSNSFFGKMAYNWGTGKVTAEYHHSHYLSQQAGGLTDSLALSQPTSSTRSRNWFELPWKMASVQIYQTFKENLKMNATINYLLGQRNSVGYLKNILIQDTFNTNIGSYNLRDVDRDFYNTLSSELRLSYTYKIGTKKQLLTGGFRYCHSDINRKQKGIGTGGSDFDLTVSLDNYNNEYLRNLFLQTQNLALFTEQLFNVGNRLSLVPGIRVESIQSSMNGRSNQVLGGYISQLEKNRFILLGGFSAKYKVFKNTPASMVLYANINQNYRPVTYSELMPSSTNEVVDPLMKDVNGYSSELGFKGQRLFRRLILNYDFNAFYIQYNQKIGTLIVDGNPFKTNIGDLKSQGVEAYLEFIFMNPFFRHSHHTEQLSLFFSGSYTDARYTKWENPAIANNIETSIVGKQAEYAPKEIFTTGFEYKLGGFALNYQYHYTASCFSDAANTVLPNATASVGLIPSLGLHDVSASILLFDNYQWKLGVNNLLDQIGPVRRSGGYPGPGLLINQGRSFYTTLSIKF